MAKGVFIHNQSSQYDDKPEAHYHFPKMYKSRVQATQGDWVLYYESGSNGGSQSYKAIAKVSHIEPDDTREGLFYAYMVPQTYLPFEKLVPLTDENRRPLNSYLVDERGLSSRGRQVAAVRPISETDFAKIVNLGLPDQPTDLPRIDDVTEQTSASDSYYLREMQNGFAHEESRDRVETKLNRWVRDRAFRVNVLNAYDRRCAFTGMRFINGGGRAEVQAAHIQPVAAGGPDSTRNGIALSGTIHWMFDRGLLSLADSDEILVSRHINNVDEINRLLVNGRKAILPKRPSERPHKDYLNWHRNNCFKV